MGERRDGTEYSSRREGREPGGEGIHQAWAGGRTKGGEGEPTGSCESASPGQAGRQEGGRGRVVMCAAQEGEH